MRKKKHWLLAALLFALTLSGCGETAKPKEKTSSVQKQEEAEDTKKQEAEEKKKPEDPDNLANKMPEIAALKEQLMEEYPFRSEDRIDIDIKKYTLDVPQNPAKKIVDYYVNMSFYPENSITEEDQIAVVVQAVSLIDDLFDREALVSYDVNIYGNYKETPSIHAKNEYDWAFHPANFNPFMRRKLIWTKGAPLLGEGEIFMPSEEAIAPLKREYDVYQNTNSGHEYYLTANGSYKLYTVGEAIPEGVYTVTWVQGVGSFSPELRSDWQCDFGKRPGEERYRLEYKDIFLKDGYVLYVKGEDLILKFTAQ